MGAMNQVEAAYHAAMQTYFKGAKLLRVPGVSEFADAMRTLAQDKPEHAVGVNAWLKTVKVGAA